jgi:hypothetical protein
MAIEWTCADRSYLHADTESGAKETVKTDSLILFSDRFGRGNQMKAPDGASSLDGRR